MIAGTIVSEDCVIHFQINQETATAQYTVCDAMTGEQETREVDGPTFMHVLGMGLQFTGDYSERFSPEQVESVQPKSKNKALRLIP